MKATQSIKALVSAGAIVATTMTAFSAVADSTTHGSACTAPNLRQALNLGLGLSQFGAANNQPIGGGSFFIVCPITMDSDHTDVGDNDAADFTVSMDFLDPLAEDVTCSILETDGREVEGSSGGFTVTNNGGAPGGRNQGVTFGHSFAGGQDGMSIVCAMPPQARLNQITAE